MLAILHSDSYGYAIDGVRKFHNYALCKDSLGEERQKGVPINGRIIIYLQVIKRSLKYFLKHQY